MDKEYAAMRAFVTSIGGAHLLGPNMEEVQISDSLEKRAAQLLPFNTDFFFDIEGAPSSGQLLNVFLSPVNVPFGEISFNDELLKLTEAEKEELQSFRAQLRKLFITDSASMSSYSGGSMLESSFDLKEYLKSKTNGYFTNVKNIPVTISNKNYFLFVNETYKLNKKLVLDYQIVSLVESFSKSERLSCYNKAATELYPLIDALVARKFTLSYAKIVSEKMVPTISNELKKILSEAQWISPQNLERVLEKLNNLSFSLLHNGGAMNHQELQAFYQDLDSNNTETFFELQLRVGKLNADHEFKDTLVNGGKVLLYFRRKIYSITGTVNAAYFWQENKIIWPYPITLKPMAIKKTPSFVNNAGIGYVMGHEIGHAIDYNMKVDQNITSKMSCFLEQYNAFVEPVTNRSVNGLKTMEENVADYWGMVAAYRASFLSSTPDWRSLPGLYNYSVRQQFWMMVAANWCTSMTKDHMQNYMETNVHSVPRFRVNGAMQNIKEFSNDFHCSSDSKMKSNQKCHSD